jgi:hypothetical protein
MELKKNIQLWDDAFGEYTFPTQFLAAMNCFNLKYECLDARDDFKFQQKKLQLSFGSSNQGNNYIDYADEYEDDFLEELGKHVGEDGKLFDEYQLGKNARRRAGQMQTAENMITRTGWLDQSPFNCAESEARNIPTLEALIQEEAEEALKKKMACMQLSQDADSQENNGDKKTDIPSNIQDASVGLSEHAGELAQEYDPISQGPLSTNTGPNDWKVIVKNAKQQAINIKLANYKAPSAKANTSANENVNALSDFKHKEGFVKVVDMSFLNHKFRPNDGDSAALIDSIAAKATLNKEQRRAFTIIANHASSGASAQLKMYLGGMGGTGKSQVIKALIELFKKRGEAHRFVVLAPSGTAAALLNGATYHSFLGINTRGKDEDGAIRTSEAASINDTRERLKGVEYIFIDEVSMIACNELYAISSKLSSVTQAHDLPFGGMNMILAGDFAQLPPTGGNALYVHMNHDNGPPSTPFAQQKAIGKLLWHQFTTVVILKQNMRQNKSGGPDAALRSALENMRYGACTDDDITFLKSRVSRRLTATDLSLPKYKNVSIITCWNSFKDQYNSLASARFAADTQQKLIHFYSVDYLGSIEEKTTAGKKRKKRGSVRARLTESLQRLLWSCDPHTSEHIPARVSLCLGLPVLIRYNDATELCITKGQEGLVIGWNSRPGPYNTLTLDTVYVRLVRPPQTVKIPGLPTNVVPICNVKHPIKCELPDDTILNVEREQVNLLPNFSMTDYSAQGKTRAVNVVDLSKAGSLQSMYTCLSRSSSAEDTIIAYPFDPKTLVTPITGYLRQEFRETMLLDRITELKYLGQLPPSVSGSLRYPLLNSFKAVKATFDSAMSDLPDAIKYGENDSISEPGAADYLWDGKLGTMEEEMQRLTKLKALEKGKKSKSKGKHRETITESTCDKSTSPSSSTAAVHTGQKLSQPQVSGPVSEPDARSFKRTKTASEVPWSSQDSVSNIAGFQWDHINYSCAYDSLFTIFYSLWASDTVFWSTSMSAYSAFMKTLVDGFHLYKNKSNSLENARDKVRSAMHSADPDRFPTGYTFISMYDLAAALLNNRYIGQPILKCRQCNFSIDSQSRSSEWKLYTLTTVKGGTSPRRLQFGNDLSIAQILHIIPSVAEFPCHRCPEIRLLDREMQVTQDMPSILIFELADKHIMPDLTLRISSLHMSNVYILRGLIYHGSNHFTSRVVDLQGQVWYNDGAVTGRQSRLEGHLNGNGDRAWLKTAHGKSLHAVVYAQQSHI